MKINIYIIAIVLLTACSKNDATVEVDDLQDVEVAINTILTGTVSESFAKTDYDRPGSAPVWVSGISIRAENTTYPSWGYKEETFLFEDDDDQIAEPITMDLKVGWNEFRGTGVVPNDPFFTAQNHYFDPKFEGPLGTLDEKAKFYSDSLLKIYPIYATYLSDTVSRHLLFENDGNKAHIDHTIDLAFKPITGRINIIFETELDLGYPWVYTLYDENGNEVYSADNTNISRVVEADGSITINVDADTDPDLVSRNGVHSYHSAATPVVFNVEEMTAGSYVEVLLYKRPKSRHPDEDGDPAAQPDVEVIGPGEMRIYTEPGVNLTYVITYDGIETDTGYFSIGYDAFTVINGGEDLVDSY